MKVPAFLAIVVMMTGALALPAPLHAQDLEGLEQMRSFALRLLAEGLYQESIEAYQAVTAATPDDPQSHYDLAGALGFVRRYSEATEAINIAIHMNPNDVRYHELAAIAYQQMRRYDDAMIATRRGAELGDIKAMYTLAGMYEHGRGTPPSQELALHWLRRAAESGHMGAMHGMANVYRDGLYGQQPNAMAAQRWQQRLRQELGR